jgi:hypothetical protein
MKGWFVRSISTRPLFPWCAALFFCSAVLVENQWFGHRHFIELTGVSMIDMNLFNSRSAIVGFMDDIGPAGRASYVVLLACDFFLIITFFLFSTAMLYKLFEANSLSAGYSWLMLIPACRGVCDIVETVSMAINTALYPKVFPHLVGLAMVSTPAKWLFLGANGAVLVALALRLNLSKRTIRRRMA